MEQSIQEWKLGKQGKLGHHLWGIFYFISFQYSAAKNAKLKKTLK